MAQRHSSYRVTPTPGAQRGVIGLLLKPLSPVRLLLRLLLLLRRRTSITSVCEMRSGYLAVYCPRLTRLNIGLLFSSAKLTMVRKLLLLDL